VARSAYQFIFLSLIFLGTSLSNAFARADLDRRFSIQTIGYLEAWDNVDGLFSEYVEDAYSAYFSSQKRFRLKDMSKASRVLRDSDIPYRQLMDDREVLSKIARTAEVDSLIRTKIFKDGVEYRVEMDWLIAPQMELIAQRQFPLAERSQQGGMSLQEINLALYENLQALLKALPFIGQITGRDERWVTIDLGKGSGVEPGMRFQVATIADVKTHPLLGHLVDWRMEETGVIQVEDIDQEIAFCRIVTEEEGRRVNRFQKLVRKIDSAEKKDLDLMRGPIEGDHPRKHGSFFEKAFSTDEQPRLGWATGGAWMGNLHRQVTLLGADDSTEGQGKEGSGVFYGVKGDAQLWLTREVFIEAGVGLGYSSVTQMDIGSGGKTGAGELNVNAKRLRGALGYVYFLDDDLFGPKGWLRGGYDYLNFGMPGSLTLLSGPLTFSGLFVGAGGDLPLRNNFSALLSFDLGLMTSVKQSGLDFESQSSASQFSFFLGGYYQLSPRMIIRGGVDILLQSADFQGNATISQRQVLFSPSFLYYF
jgi:hypothetical protein